MGIYQRNPDAAPDDDFEPGALHHLVPGNAGRLLDARRTPVTIVALRPEAGTFVVRLDDFEDAGATWEIPYERVVVYQFARGCARATAGEIAAFEATVARLDRPYEIDADAAVRPRTEARIGCGVEEAAAWLAAHGAFLAAGAALPDPATRTGDPRLADDLARFMDQRGLLAMETAFAERFVRNPDSGELVKGHCIVLAELGLAPFAGTVVRDPALFDGAWARARRAEHIVARLAFVRASFAALGLDRVTLHRGMSIEGPVEPDRPRTFLSASFCRDVALAHFDAGDPATTGILRRAAVPVTRLFMTYHETAAMNERYREAEAVLLAPGDDDALAGI